jgi:hypothetical protein
MHCTGYVRYVDDLLLFADDKDVLWSWLGRIERLLAGLRLRLHAGAHPRPVGEGIPFLGFVLFPARRPMKRRKVVYAKRRMARLVAAHAAGIVSTAQVSASIAGWVNHARSGSTTGLRKAVLRRLRLYPRIGRGSLEEA